MLNWRSYLPQSSAAWNGGPGYRIFGNILPYRSAYDPDVDQHNCRWSTPKLRLASSDEGISNISSDTYRVVVLPSDVLTSQSELSLEEPNHVASVADAIELATAVDELLVPFVALVSPDVILHHGFAEELRSAITDPGLGDLHWTALASDGIDLTGEPFDTGNYPEDPATPTAGPLRIADWSEPAISVISTAALKRLRADDERFDSFPDIVRAGASNDLPVFLTRRLRYSSISDRGPQGSQITSDRPSAQAADVSLGTIRTDPSITVVIRTMFERPWLLNRNLAALAAEHQRSPILEAIVVSTADISKFSNSSTQINGSIETLPLEMLQAREDSIPSRSAAMLAGLAAARGDYVWYVDDDDWIAEGSVQSIKDAVHALDRPILIGASEVFEEHWEESILTTSSPTRRYLPREWYRAFTGWNFLPNCSVALPRILAQHRISECPITRNFGEDYALQLLLLTAPGSTVQVIDETIANISRRSGSDNAVTMTDRVPWLRDLGSHISDLSRDPSTSTAAFWRLGSEIRNIPYPETGSGIEDSDSDLGSPAPSPSPTEHDLRERLRRAKNRIRRQDRHDPG